MYRKYQYVYGIWYYLQFQASAWDLGMYSSQVRGDYGMNKKIWVRDIIDSQPQHRDPQTNS